MKLFSTFFTALVAVVMLASCNSGERYESTYFSVEIPNGMKTVDTGEKLADIPNLSFKSDNESELGSIIMFPFQADPKIMLTNQTVGGMNPAFHGMTFGEMEEVTIDDIRGWKVKMTGTLAEIFKGEGVVFCADIDKACVLVYTIGEKGIPAFTDKFIGSIKINKEAVDAVQADPTTAVETVVTMSRVNLPVTIDRETTWEAIKIDNETKTVTMVMKLNGTAADFEGLAELLTANRDAVAQSMRQSKESDLLINVPASYGYNLAYQYVAADSDEPLGTLTITADELK